MTQDYESYVERREAALKERKWDKADFTMCPRKHLRPANKIAPWDKEDTCRCCGVPVLYDSRDSEGRPHLCPPCVEYIIKSGSYQQLKSFLSLEVDENSTDEEIVRRIQTTIDQNKANESAGAHPKARGLGRPETSSIDIYGRRSRTVRPDWNKR